MSFRNLIENKIDEAIDDFFAEDIDAELLERIAEMTDDEFESFCEFCVEAQLDELSPETLSNYRKKAFKSYKKSGDALGRTTNFSRRVSSDKAIDKHNKIVNKRHKGIGSADKRRRARSGDDSVGRWDLDTDAGYHTLSKKTSKQMQKIKGYGKDQSGKNKIVSPNGKTAYVSSSEIKDYLDRGWKRSSK
jgi:wobble nucleotide-excising tRNase